MVEYPDYPNFVVVQPTKYEVEWQYFMGRFMLD
jgi:hypothetical protein